MSAVLTLAYDKHRLIVVCCVLCRSILSRDGVLFVKLRAGQLPYKDDPMGLNSLLSPNPDVSSFKVRVAH